MKCEWCKKADLGNFSAKYDKHSANIHLASGSYRFPKDEQFKFCPNCGKPLTAAKPLSLNELRERDGRPVWMVRPYARKHKAYWAIQKGHREPYGFTLFDYTAYHKLSEAFTESNYGKAWTVYDHPPETSAE